MVAGRMSIDELVRNPGEWLRGEGKHPQIVISSRARLARNVAGFPFSTRIGEEEKRQLADILQQAVARVEFGAPFTYFDCERLSELQRHVLLERHLISREHADGEGCRGVAVNPSESLSIMVNEEDHLRLQSLRSGLQLEECFRDADRLDDELCGRLDFAFDEEFGFLTCCPTNIGTGLRASVMLHLPALVATRHIDKVLRAAHDLKLAVRGLYGEGTEAHGELYQISNQVTTGRDEWTIIADLEAFIDEVIAYELKARKHLLKTEPVKLQDRVWRAFGILTSARVMNSEEAMRLLSSVRLGVCLEILPPIDYRELNVLFLFSQPAHLQQVRGRELSPEERDRVRAEYVRNRLRELAG